MCFFPQHEPQWKFLVCGMEKHFNEMSWKLRFNFHQFYGIKNYLLVTKESIYNPPFSDTEQAQKKINLEIFSFIFQLILIKFCMRKSVTIRRMWLMIENIFGVFDKWCCVSQNLSVTILDLWTNPIIYIF